MPPVIFEARDVVAGGRFLQEVRVSTFPPSSDLPQGIRCSACLMELASREVVLLYDVHRGKSHHRHSRQSDPLPVRGRGQVAQRFSTRCGAHRGGKAMNSRRLYIGIRQAAERSKALRDAMQCVAKGDRTQQDSGLYFENIDELRRVLTEKRMELLLAISRHRPASVRELAGLVQRDYKNVNTDISLLQRLGLVRRQARQGTGAGADCALRSDPGHDRFIRPASDALGLACDRGK
jgi:predicted transcriptional regulator